MSVHAWWNPRVRLLPLCVAAALLYIVALRLLARYDIVSVIFAIGDHTPLWMLVAAFLFVLLRLFIGLVVPGLVAAALVLGWWKWHARIRFKEQG